ncbi:MAG: N-acetylmuramic acid 6-phosphate etherase [Deinococcota bacterium]|nr:N-acetylmuramic acid 6-phosphate etherase [Deinococcota bacterium]
MNTETMNEAYRDLDAWPAGRILEAVVASSARAVRAVERALPQLERAAEALKGRLEAGGRLVYVGAGTSGRLALLDSAELYPTFGWEGGQVLLAGGGEAWSRAKEGAEDDEDAARGEIGALELGAGDAVIGVAASGRTPYTVAALRAARERGALTIGVANNVGAPLLMVADIGVLLDTGAEVLAGSTRLAAGTAQKVALGALSTAVLVRLGGAYGNRMVGMRPVNDKLKRRAALMVADASGAPLDRARAVLEETAWDIRAATVMLVGGHSLEAARARLQSCGNRVREALEER